MEDWVLTSTKSPIFSVNFRSPIFSVNFSKRKKRVGMIWLATWVKMKKWRVCWGRQPSVWTVWKSSNTFFNSPALLLTIEHSKLQKSKVIHKCRKAKLTSSYGVRRDTKVFSNIQSDSIHDLCSENKVEYVFQGKVQRITVLTFNIKHELACSLWFM